MALCSDGKDFTLFQSEKKAILAGALIAIGALFSIAATKYGNVVQGFCFSVGLFGVLCCGARLFTGQVLGIQDCWRGNVSVGQLLTTWAHTWAYNLLGSVVVAAIAHFAGFDATKVVWSKTLTPTYVIFCKAILCNVMVCLSVWCYRYSGGGPVNAFFFTLLPVACFVACGFEHSIADMLYMSLGLMAKTVSAYAFLRVVLVATVGNVIGGTLFSWLVYEVER